MCVCVRGVDGCGGGVAEEICIILTKDRRERDETGDRRVERAHTLSIIQNSAYYRSLRWNIISIHTEEVSKRGKGCEIESLDERGGLPGSSTMTDTCQ